MFFVDPSYHGMNMTDKLKVVEEIQAFVLDQVTQIQWELKKEKEGEGG